MVVGLVNLKLGHPEFESLCDHQLDLIFIVSVSTPQLHSHVHGELSYLLPVRIRNLLTLFGLKQGRRQRKPRHQKNVI